MVILGEHGDEDNDTMIPILKSHQKVPYHNFDVETSEGRCIIMFLPFMRV